MPINPADSLCSRRYSLAVRRGSVGVVATTTSAALATSATALTSWLLALTVVAVTSTVTTTVSTSVTTTAVRGLLTRRSFAGGLALVLTAEWVVGSSFLGSRGIVVAVLTSISASTATSAVISAAATRTSSAVVTTTTLGLLVTSRLFLLLSGGLAFLGTGGVGASSGATAIVLATAIILGTCIRVNFTGGNRLLVTSNTLVGGSLLGKNDLEARELAADGHLLETLLNRLVLVIDNNGGDFVDLMEASNAMLYNLSNGDGLSDGLSKR